MSEARPFSLVDAVPAAARGPILDPLLKLIEAVSGLGEMQRRYESLPPARAGREFIDEAFRALSFRYELAPEQLARVPANGATIVVANHPFGGIDGMVLAHLLAGVRPDVRILANPMLERIPGMREFLIGVDPFRRADAPRRNAAALRRALKWLRGGGLLVAFPAGEVSHYQWHRMQCTDPDWSDTAVRLARMTRARVVPVYFHGRNSIPFNIASLLNPWLRTLMLPRELLRRADGSVRVSIGNPVEASTLDRIACPAAATRYLRTRTYMLGAIARLPHAVEARDGAAADAQDLIDPVPARLLEAEIQCLPAEQRLCASGSLEVYAARAAQIPWALQEIGRLREQTFRLAGEGAGGSVDLDLHDAYYRHLFIWHAEERRIAGAYRLGILEDILRSHGARGVYTRSLFQYEPGMLLEIGPALELGRSFVRGEYQRSHQGLGLLWKGIAQFVLRHGLPVLFGPVSISRDYSPASRRLMIECLRRNHWEPALARQVRPRRPFRGGNGVDLRQVDLSGVADVELLSDLVAQIEESRRGVPVLVRQYLKMGAKFLAFSVDPDFSDVIDGLIVVDLRRTEPALLARYMGADAARAFLERCRPGEKRLSKAS